MSSHTTTRGTLAPRLEQAAGRPARTLPPGPAAPGAIHLPKTLTVYLMRHGQTAYNINDRMRGRADLPLTDEGLAQAQALGQLFANVTLARVVASPLQRAVRTAEPVAQAAGLQVEPIEGLNDRDYGPWTGKLRSEVQQRFGSVDAAPGVESWDTLRLRVRQAFEALLNDARGPAIVLVGHDATNRALIAGLVPGLQGTPQGIPQANGCWNRLEWAQGRWTLAVLNARPGDGQRP